MNNKIQDIKIDKTYEELLRKLSSHLSTLTKMVDGDYKNKDAFENISLAFRTENNPEKLLDGYKKFINKYFQALLLLKSKYENIKFEEHETVLKSFENEVQEFEKLKTTYEDFKALYLYSLKEQLLDMNYQIVFEKNNEYFDKQLKEYQNIISKINNISKNSHYKDFRLVKEDTKSIDELPIKISSNESFEKSKIIIFSSLFLIAAIFMGVGIWLLI